MAAAAMTGQQRKTLLLAGAGAGVLWLLSRGPSYVVPKGPDPTNAYLLPPTRIGTIPLSHVTAPGHWQVGQVIRTADGAQLTIIPG